MEAVENAQLTQTALVVPNVTIIPVLVLNVAKTLNVLIVSTVLWTIHVNLDVDKILIVRYPVKPVITMSAPTLNVALMLNA